MIRWGSTAVIWLLAPVAGLVVFIALSTLAQGAPFDWEDLMAISFATLWVGGALWVSRLHASRGGRVIHILGCFVLLPTWCSLLLFSFL